MFHTIIGRAIVLVIVVFAACLPVRAAGSLQGENLLLPLPSGFKLGHDAHNSRASLSEYVPKGETVDDWTRMITVRVDYKLDADPDAFSKSLGKLTKKTCPGADDSKVTDGVENGYPFAVWLYICPLNPKTNKPETMMMKTVRGSDSFYDVQYASRAPAGAHTVTLAATYLRTVRVCDTRRPKRACPAGM